MRGVNVPANFDLASGIVGPRGSAVTASTMQPWRDGWYRCMLITSSPTANSFGACIVGSINVVRNESSTLATSIYVAGPHVEEGTFATSYIPTTTNTVTRAGDFASITGPHFTSWNNRIQCTLVVGFQKLYSCATDITRTLLSGDGPSNKRLIYLVVNSKRVASFDGDTGIVATGDATGPFVKCVLSYSSPGGRSIALGGTNVVAGAIASGASALSYTSIRSLNGSEVMCG